MLVFPAVNRPSLPYGDAGGAEFAAIGHDISSLDCVPCIQATKRLFEIEPDRIWANATA